MKFAHLFCLVLFTSLIFAQPDRWQQAVHYEMDIRLDVTTDQFEGWQRIIYQNNSPDELDRVFYHLFFNAFQPNSMMDMRSRTISDPDGRVRDRISKLTDSEIGYHHILSMKQDGQEVNFYVEGTILEVELNQPIAPHSQTLLEMEFESQVPVQIRRSGRDNAEGIQYSMAQWYPKLCEYDYQGWHANPYVGREFYGVWGNFDVKITMDKSYTVGGSGYLQNPNEIGHGYQGEGVTAFHDDVDELTWHFFAPGVHDFVWAADPDYKHVKKVNQDGTTMHFLYQENDRNRDEWAQLPDIMDEAFHFINRRYGWYPYRQYSFIQGGDGGMEYPMATLITGNRSLGSLVGVSVHELMHSWYQMVLGSNESLYAWMDEGFTSFASTEIMNHLAGEGLLGENSSASENPFKNTYDGFARFARSGREEPLSTHSDHFVSNSAYGVGAYTKGSIFMRQLEYILGRENFDKALLDYFETWKFKHPNANDVIRVFEKNSGLELDWYREYMVNTTHTIDYGVQNIEDRNGLAIVTLERVGIMPMPVDVVVTRIDGTKVLHHIPLRIMRGEKPRESVEMGWEVEADWPWTHPTYELSLDFSTADLDRVEIDPSYRMMDVDLSNNVAEGN